MPTVSLLFPGCLSSSAESLVKEECHNRRSCSINADEPTFSNLCPGIGKYLKVTFICGKWPRPGGKDCSSECVLYDLGPSILHIIGAWMGDRAIDSFIFKFARRDIKILR